MVLKMFFFNDSNDKFHLGKCENTGDADQILVPSRDSQPESNSIQIPYSHPGCETLMRNSSLLPSTENDWKKL